MDVSLHKDQHDADKEVSRLEATYPGCEAITQKVSLPRD